MFVKQQKRIMKIKLDIWKRAGKWHASEEHETKDIEEFIGEFDRYPSMLATVYIIEEDGFLQPYRMFIL